MSKNHFRPSEYTLENAILDAGRYGGGIYIGDNYVTKDHGDYIQMNVDADNDKGHISFDIRYDSDGNITDIESHK